MDLSYAFTIFFLTLGPLKVLPAFYKLTNELDQESLRKIAIRGVAFSLVIVLIVALASHMVFNAWRVSLHAFTLTGGILLFLSSFKMINNFKMPKASKTKLPEARDLKPDEINMMALSPLTIPIAISPIGVVAVLAAVSIAHSDKRHDTVQNLMELLGLILCLFVLNLICMWFVRGIMQKISVPVYLVIGWVFSILQAGLAIQFIVNSIHFLFPA